MTNIELNESTILLYARCFMTNCNDRDFIDSMRATTRDDDDTRPLTIDDCDDFADACIPELRDDLDDAILHFMHRDATDADIDAFTDAFSRMTRELYTPIYDTMRDAARQRFAITHPDRL